MSPSPGGLQVTESGISLVAAETYFNPATASRFVFRIEQEGATVTDYDELHERRMHLIVVRRDLHGFQHVHPRFEDGQWITEELRTLEPGVWRAFADFSTGGRPMTLGIDLHVEGEYRP